MYDGPDPSSPVLLRFSGVFDGSQLLISSQNHLYIYFYTNYAIAGRGFTINYKQGAHSAKLCSAQAQNSSVCDFTGCENVIKESYGSLLSPGHNQVPYPSSQTCSYTIEIPETDNPQPVTLAVDRFDVPADDYLEVSTH